MVSSGGSDDSDPVEVDFCGEAPLLKYRVLRSGRPEALEAVDEICDCDWVTRALEDRRGSVIAAIAHRKRDAMTGQEQLLTRYRGKRFGTRRTCARRPVSRLDSHSRQLD